ncbi:hypothetical protein [Sphingobacterium cellulitidis]|uniref:hypothetical protein n=1 Tax=Sphingobacterium cellulitidis TaxID=1768011 RepID=UPI00370D1A38
MMKFISFLHKNVYNYSLSKKTKQLKLIDYSNKTNVLEYQKSKLFHIVELAQKSIPYYRNSKKISDLNFSYGEFQKIPLLTKDIIREEGSSLINTSYSKKNQVFLNTSGGSTGEPVSFYQTINQVKAGLANYYYGLSLNHVNIYEKSVDLWGAQRDMYNSGSKFNIKDFLHNKVSLNTFVLSDEIISDYITRMNNIKPHFIKAYVHSIFEISKYIIANNIEIKFKPIIHCTTGPLYPEMKKLIKKAFNEAHVYNFYGSREVSAIASELADASGLLVFFDNVFLEILNEDGTQVQYGEEGEVVVTTLNNFYMPLLRYKIGDRAVKGDDLEFGTLNLMQVTGRTLGVIHKNDGTKIDGQFFTSLFFNKNTIKGFQMVQKSISLIELKIVKTINFNQDELNEVVSLIKDNLPNCDVDVVFVEKIDLSSTGKLMYVYSELS